MATKMYIPETCVACDSEDIVFINEELYHCKGCNNYYDTEEYLDEEFYRHAERLRKKNFNSERE